MSEFEPAYLKLLRSGELSIRAQKAYQMLENCCLCAQNCGVNRLDGVLGICRTGMRAKISSYGPHLGEEKPLRGWRGSGTIFFSRCNMHCQYCQNYDISQTDHGYEVETEELATIMLELQSLGCHNINFVSPSHVVAQILAGVLIAAQAGLHLPLVYNTGGYDSLESLKLLDGVIDIYMPDMKYASAQIGRHYSKVRNYPQINQQAILEMHRQVGDLYIDEKGLAKRGLLIRHLVLPHGLAGTQETMKFISEKISVNTYVNIMDQYHPAYNARRYPKLARPITSEEYQHAEKIALDVVLKRLDRPTPRE